ncbi:MAG TPA: hypothetical protein V6C81_26705 [Planktothrix sp.]|jgi:hypothetical protein
MTEEKKKRKPGEPVPLAEELGIEDIRMPIFGGRGRLFSAAGKESPVAEFNKEFLVLHPPDKPFTEADENGSEDFMIKVDKRGILLDELGNPKVIHGARYKGAQLWYLGDQKKGTLKHYAGYFDQHETIHKLYVNNEPLTSDIIYRLRNKTHDGEVSIFPDIKSD